MKKKQTKADKAFIESIKSLGINTRKGNSEMPKCDGCDEPMVPVKVAAVRITRVPKYLGEEDGRQAAEGEALEKIIAYHGL